MTVPSDILRTIFVRPFDGEEAAGLIVETRRATIEDSRVADLACRLAPSETFRREEESDTEFSGRAWRLILPETHAGDALQARREYGWSHSEIMKVHLLLTTCEKELRSLARAGGISRETLLRSADTINALDKRWLVLSLGCMQRTP